VEPEPGADVAPVLVLSPMTEMALPPTVTGMATGATTCEPPAIEFSPPVVASVADPLPLVPAVVEASWLSLSPTTETALPLTVIGTFTDTMPCVPESSPLSPEVVAGVAGLEEAAG
jgi:hypothetical protein